MLPGRRESGKLSKQHTVLLIVSAYEPWLSEFHKLYPLLKPAEFLPRSMLVAEHLACLQGGAFCLGPAQPVPQPMESCLLCCNHPTAPGTQTSTWSFNSCWGNLCLWASVKVPCETRMLPLVKDEHFVVPGLLLLCAPRDVAAVSSPTGCAEESGL